MKVVVGGGQHDDAESRLELAGRELLRPGAKNHAHKKKERTNQMYLIDSYQFETLYKILSSTSEVDVKTKHNSKQMTRKKNKTEQNKTKRLQ